MAVCHKDIGKRLWVAGRPAIRLHLLRLHAFSLNAPCIAFFLGISNGAGLHECTTSTKYLSKNRLHQPFPKKYANDSANRRVWGGILGDYIMWYERMRIMQA